ncbi:serpentine type 7TM GPCR chemoreceptor srt domain-containing protein [Ditylenchus destructor]|nr:serpentine type 7TM GPCR chemoreceptor srt domain-containing protein [Ditylenchus destructor]
MSVVLTLYRCFELSKFATVYGNNPSSQIVFAADWFFQGKRSLVWISLSLLHSITVALFVTPSLYSPIFGSNLLNPHAGYIGDIDGRFYSLHKKLYPMALLFVGIVLFVAFVYLMRSLRKINSNGPSHQALAAEKKALVQAVIITSCFVVSISYWAIIFSGKTVPWIAIFIGMTLTNCTHGAPGLLYVCMNKTVRDSVWKLFRIKTNSTTVSIITLNNR